MLVNYISSHTFGYVFNCVELFQRELLGIPVRRVSWVTYCMLLSGDPESVRVSSELWRIIKYFKAASCTAWSVACNTNVPQPRTVKEGTTCHFAKEVARALLYEYCFTTYVIKFVSSTRKKNKIIKFHHFSSSLVNDSVLHPMNKL
jgi:hypothetical protein